MLNWLGFTLVAVAGGWAAFYSIKRARGRKWPHWVGWAIALASGLLMVTTLLGEMLRWTATWVPFGALVLFIIFALITVYDLSDKRPDAGAMIGALILPSLLAIVIVQAGQFGDAVKDNGQQIKTKMESGGGR